MEILVIQTAFPGDLFLSIPLLKQTRKFYPKAKISLLCREGLGGFFIEQDLVDRIFEIKKGKSKSYSKVAEDLKDIHFDIILNPHRSFRTALLVSNLKRSVTVGFKRWWNVFFFNRRIDYPQGLPDALRQLSLLAEVNEDFKKIWKPEEWSNRLLGSRHISPMPFPDSSVLEWSSMQVQPWMPNGKVAYLAPGSVWATKKWKVESFTALALRLLDQGYEVVLTGSGADKKDCDTVAAADSRIKNTCGRTSLTELLELFQTAKVLVANDSGAIHIAAAAGLPTVAIFGPTVPEYGFRPWNKNSLVVQLDLGCRPCSRHGTAKCPIGTHACMRDLSVDQVFTAVQTLMESHP